METPNPSPAPAREPAATAPFAPRRWAGLARAIGIDSDAPVAIALSGGADSVYLLHVVAAARPRPPLLAVHVDHRLRGEESDADARFCAELCGSLALPCEIVRAPLAPGTGSLEARARDARYAALAKVALEHGIGFVATGHHADDALETLLMRWMRGTDLFGLAAMPARRALRPPPREAAHPSAPRIELVRPLLALRREEVRAALRERGIAWREDSSNASDRFTRNRLRNDLLPRVRDVAGEGAIDHLRAFASAVEALEEQCATLTGELVWSSPAHAAARRGALDAHLGGEVARGALMRLAPTLRRRALARLVAEGTGAMPGRALLDALLDDLGTGRCARRALPGAWSLHLRARTLVLEPPPTRRASAVRVRQLELFDAPAHGGQALVPQRTIDLADGRRISCSLAARARGAPVPRSPLETELDAGAIALPLSVRFLRAGDRFHPLGARGSRRLVRFLADSGVPRADRARVPLVLSGDEIVWVAGLRPSERAKVTAATTERLVLALHHPALPALPRPQSLALFEAAPTAARRREA